MYGIDVTYIPRKFVNKQSIIEEVQSSKFDDEQSANLPGSLNFLVEVLRSISFSCFLLFLSSNLLIAMLSKSFALGGFEDSQ